MVLPNEKLDGSIVIASSYMNEDEQVVVLLNPEAPFFSIAYVAGFRATRVHSESNFVGAATAYIQFGGDPSTYDDVARAMENAEVGR